MQEDIIKLLTENSKPRKVPKNTILLHEGEVCRSFVFLKDGITRHYFTDRKGNDVTKNFSTGPATFMYSISSFITQEPGIVQCETLSDVVLYEIDFQNFQKLLETPVFSDFWSKKLSKFIVKKENKEISLLRDDATTRYNTFLKDFPGLLNKIPHYYIASYLSISPETLSRIRKTIS